MRLGLLPRDIWELSFHQLKQLSDAHYAEFKIRRQEVAYLAMWVAQSGMQKSRYTRLKQFLNDLIPRQAKVDTTLTPINNLVDLANMRAKIKAHRRKNGHC